MATCGGVGPIALAGQIWVPMVQGQVSRWDLSSFVEAVKTDLLKYFGSQGRPLQKKKKSINPFV